MKPMHNEPVFQGYWQQVWEKNACQDERARASFTNRHLFVAQESMALFVVRSYAAGRIRVLLAKVGRKSTKGRCWATE
jgi:hypothetical protein